MAEGGNLDRVGTESVILDQVTGLDTSIITSDNLVVDQPYYRNLVSLYHRLPGSIAQDVRVEIAEFLASSKNEDLRSMIDLNNPDLDSNISLMVEFSQADFHRRKDENLDLFLASAKLSVKSAMDL